MARLALAAMLGMSALPAIAQSTDPFDHPVEGAPPKPRNATSSLQATAPTPTEVHDARSLATAVFSRPAAAKAAADKVTAAAQVDVPPLQPKPEWSPDGVQVGGKGLQIKTPF
jgi:hypothetical protein